MSPPHETFALARASQAALLTQASDRIAEQVRDHRDAGRFRGAGPILTGIGASLSAACAPSWVLRSRGIHAWRLGAGDHPLPWPASGHPVIGISQSGRSPETIAVMGSIPRPRRYAVSNLCPSPLTRVVDAALSLGNLPDSYASTVGFTATIMGLGMIADAWDGGDIDPAWADLPDALRSTASLVEARAGELAATFAGATNADFVGAGPSVGSAEAGALLFREVARLPSTAMSTRQYLHGSMESAGRGVHVVLGDHRELGVCRTLSDAGHRVILVTTEEVAESRTLQTVRIPDLPPAPRAIIEALVLQTLVAEVARQSGVPVEEFVFHNPDTKVDVPEAQAAG